MRGTPDHTTNQMFGRRFFPVLLHVHSGSGAHRLAQAGGNLPIFVLANRPPWGFRSPGFSLGRHVEMMLRRIYPERRFEVIAASTTAINSHVLVPIARDCARLQPDLFVVYAGNNEVVGPYGAGTVFSRSAGHPG